MKWGRLSLVFCALFACLLPAHGQDTLTPAERVARSLRALNEISSQLDDIAMMSESELLQLKSDLLLAQSSLQEASSELTSLEASRLNLESSLRQSEIMLESLNKYLRTWKILAAIAGVAAAVLLLLVVSK